MSRETRPADADAGGGLRLGRSRERYLEEIAECRRLLDEGETYEVCLTNSVAADPGEVEPLELYRRLRRVNPAPFSSFVRFGEAAVLSSSPERFLRIGRDRWVEAKPIKGTSRRGATPAEDVRLAERLRSDEKNRAENLMIADLLRNDLGSVCEAGTVHAPSLMQVESYETVHQLVTTVRGLLGEERGPLDCIRACFPPGSMTGAPKRRTMRIIDELEGGPRGVYSGAIGYLGLGGGCDLSVAIRAIVLDGATATDRRRRCDRRPVGPRGRVRGDAAEGRRGAARPGPRRRPPYSRVSFSDSISRVTPRKSIVSGARSTTSA